MEFLINRVMMKLKRHSYYLLPYNEKNIRKFKSSDNMLKPVRCNYYDTSGFPFTVKNGLIGLNESVICLRA